MSTEHEIEEQPKGVLTIAELQSMKPHSVIATGTIANSPEGVYMTRNDEGRLLRWVAKRGGIHDWAIYVSWANHSEDYVMEQGDKVYSEEHIKKLVPCSIEAYDLYRR